MNASFRLIIVSLIACLLGAVPTVAAGPDPDTDAVMRVKLAAAQRLLGGIALSDFSVVRTNAAILTTLSGQRGWAALQTPDYELFSTRFRLAAVALDEAAKEQRIDAVTTAYQELTLSCVACHKYLRDGSRKR